MCEHGTEVQYCGKCGLFTLLVLQKRGTISMLGRDVNRYLLSYFSTTRVLTLDVTEQGLTYPSKDIQKPMQLKFTFTGSEESYWGFLCALTLYYGPGISGSDSYGAKLSDIWFCTERIVTKAGEDLLKSKEEALAIFAELPNRFRLVRIMGNTKNIRHTHYFKTLNYKAFLAGFIAACKIDILQPIARKRAVATTATIWGGLQIPGHGLQLLTKRATKFRTNHVFTPAKENFKQQYPCSVSVTEIEKPSLLKSTRQIIANVIFGE
ncbi:MAG: hypothetical protein ACMG6E_06070 [Candidatus Roizmanbacteria bacterium]